MFIVYSYQVSGWNAGGEGELSEPVQESSPQGKQGKEFSELVIGPSTIFHSCLLQFFVMLQLGVSLLEAQ